MAEYNIEKDGPKSFDLVIDKQNFYFRGSITGVEKRQRPSDNYPHYIFEGYNGTVRLEKTAKDYDTFTTPHILSIEGGPGTAEIGIPEEFAMEIIREVTEADMVE